jgi:hypothetical protein
MKLYIDHNAIPREVTSSQSVQTSGNVISDS